jgi:hypothetical protein
VHMLVAPDDLLALRDRILDTPRLGNEYALSVFDRLTKDIEPHLVVTEPGGAAKWFEIVVQARAAIANGSRGISPHMLETAAAVATKFWKLSGPEPQRRLQFMRNAELRRVAEEDWTRLVVAGEREDAKTAVIAGGSVVEAVALDVLETLTADQVANLRDAINSLKQEQRMNLPPARGKPADWRFGNLLFALGPSPGLQILSDRTHVIGHQLRDWRNLVHPSEARAEPPLTPADGRIAVGFAEKVVEEVQAWGPASESADGTTASS